MQKKREKREARPGPKRAILRRAAALWLVVGIPGNPVLSTRRGRARFLRSVLHWRLGVEVDGAEVDEVCAFAGCGDKVDFVTRKAERKGKRRVEMGGDEKNAKDGEGIGLGAKEGSEERQKGIGQMGHPLLVE